MSLEKRASSRTVLRRSERTQMSVFAAQIYVMLDAERYRAAAVEPYISWADSHLRDWQTVIAGGGIACSERRNLW